MVIHAGDGADGDGELFAELAGEALFQGFAVFLFAAGEFR
jgi:hypothetical protein